MYHSSFGIQVPFQHGLRLNYAANISTDRTHLDQPAFDGWPYFGIKMDANPPPRVFVQNNAQEASAVFCLAPWKFQKRPGNDRGFNPCSHDIGQTWSCLEFMVGNWWMYCRNITWQQETSKHENTCWNQLSEIRIICKKTSSFGVRYGSMWNPC